MRFILAASMLAMTCASCIVVAHEAPPPVPAPQPQPVVASSPWRIAHPIDAADHVLVIPGTNLGHPIEIEGPIDLHLGSQDEDVAFDALRHAAVQVGADAVISVRYQRSPGITGARIHGILAKTLPNPEGWHSLVVIDVDASQEDEASAVQRLIAAGRGYGEGEVAVIDFGWRMVGTHLHAHALVVKPL